MNKQIRTEIYQRLRAANPHPETELNYQSPFELLVSVILSAQATDISVNKATDRLYPVASTPAAILDLGVSKLKTYIKTIGLYNRKLKISSRPAEFCSINTKAKFRELGRRLKHYLASGAKRPTSF